ncbi:MAG: MFS transporter [Oscillospiraceae bacterium]|nr:MFS transporter [Oscillospiraceae bacterium]
MVHLLLAIIYLAFISLGLPDGLLGAAWPSVYPELMVPVSYAGAVSMTVALGTIVSSLLSDRLTWRFGAGKVTAFSVAMTACALFGFSISREYWMLILWAIPYGLGAGGVDASLNNYVALHYSSRHMSWLHCMWGVGASVGPYIMGWVLSGGNHWSGGYRIVGILQVILTAVLFLTLGLWKDRRAEAENTQPVPLKEIISIPGAKEILVTFFCYCGLEQTACLWASSYLTLSRGVERSTAAFFASLFFLGMTIGRGVNGFLTVKFDDKTLIRMGAAVIGLGIGAMLLPGRLALVGLLLVGLGCAPVYPCIIHSTPANFGPQRSQALIGVQMASAYVGTLLMPPIFGLIANHIGAWTMPLYLLGILALMAAMHEGMLRKVAE